MFIDKGICSDVYYDQNDESHKGHFVLENSIHKYNFKLYEIVEGEGKYLVKFDIWSDSANIISDKLFKFRVEMSVKGMPIHYNDNTKNVVKKSFLLSDLESDIMHLFVMKILPKILTSSRSK